MMINIVIYIESSCQIQRLLMHVYAWRRACHLVAISGTTDLIPYHLEKVSATHLKSDTSHLFY